MMRISEPKTVNTGSVVNHLGYKALRKIFADIHDIEDRLKQGETFDFPYLIRGEMSDGHRQGLKPITFLRQVTSLCTYPAMSDHMPEDVVERTMEILEHCPKGSVGSVIVRGNPVIRQHIADYISQRDLVETSTENIWITGGVLPGVSMVLDVLKRRPSAMPPGIITCVPQYMGYATLLEDQGFCVIFEFNVYTTNHPFHSVRKVMNSMGAPYSGTQLVTFNSISKGFTAEVGLQAGYFEAININRVDQANLEHATMEYLPPMLSQVALDCMIKPPRPGGASYELYTKEKSLILDSLAERARLAEERLNAIDGIHCSRVQGSMAAYPRVTIPVRAIEEAERREMEADVFYAEELLRRKGVSVTPSSAFGRLPGKFHMRIVILPPKNQLLELFDRLESFQKELMAEYS
nr:alanine aminotransferase 2-like isoform X3 [Rhipicephalus microplus]